MKASVLSTKVALLAVSAMASLSVGCSNNEEPKTPAEQAADDAAEETDEAVEEAGDAIEEAGDDAEDAAD